MTKVRTRWRIDVTDEDIERAHRNDSYRCVVAQAVARTVPTARNIDVDLQTIRFTNGDDRFWYLTPYAVQGYIAAFDAGEPIEPFSFEVRNPTRHPRKRSTPESASRASERRKAEGTRRRAENRAARKRGEELPWQPENRKRATEAAVPREVSEAASVLGAYANAGTRRPPRRVFKTKRRTYGQRVLRINQ